MPFYNTYAFREIQKLTKRDFKWSKALGTWVGNGCDAAKGVPHRFLRPETEQEKKERLERKEQKMAVEEQNKIAEAAESAKAPVTNPTESTFAPIRGADATVPDASPHPAVPGSAPPPASATSVVSQSVPSPMPVGVSAIMPSLDDPKTAMPNPAPTAMMDGGTEHGRP